MKNKPKTKDSVNSAKKKYELLKNNLLSSEIRERKLRKNIGLLIFIVGIISVFGIFGWVNSIQSQTEAETSQSNFYEAVKMLGTAESKNTETQIVLARQLSAQSQLLLKTEKTKQEVALLLAIESLRLSPNAEASEVITQNNLLYPISYMEHLWLSNGVQIVGFSPNNKYVVSLGNHDNTVRVWEAETGKEISRMTHDYSVWSADISPDGKYVVSSSEDRTIRVWELDTGKEISRMWHGAIIWSVSFSPDGKYVLSSSGDKTTRIWDVKTGNELIRLTNPNSSQAPVAMFSPDGRSVIDNATEISGDLEKLGYTRINFSRGFSSISPNSNFVLLQECEVQSPSGGCDKSVVVVWDIVKGEEVSRISIEKHIWVTRFSTNSQYVLIGGDDNYVHVIDIESDKEISKLPHTSRVYTAAFSPDGKHIISSSDDGVIRLWEIESGLEIANAIQRGVLSVSFSPDGNYIATANNSTARVWKLENNFEIAKMNNGQDPYLVVISQNGEYIISTSSNDGRQSNFVKIWKTETGKEITTLVHDNDVSAIALSSDNKYLITGSFDNIVRVWDVSAGKEISSMRHDDFVYSVAFSPNNEYIVSSSKDKTVRIWNTVTGQEIIKKAFADEISIVAFSLDGRYIVSVGKLTTHVWEAETGLEISKMEHEYQIKSMDFSPDGKSVVLGGDTITRRWHLETGKEITTYETSVSSVDFSPDGNFIVSTDFDTIRLWESDTGKVVNEIKNNANYAVFSPDGKYIVVLNWNSGVANVISANTGKEVIRLNPSIDGFIRFTGFGLNGKYVITSKGDTIQVWLYRPEDLIADACSRVTRNLSLEEWKQYIGDFLPYQAICPQLPIELENVLPPPITPTVVPSLTP
ncbi:MAG: WD40 repeat domain-containing protein [Anaerolineales bacterium]|nr:WD40 repeat domain-containing protein [Anaerolineales bacterium]MBX3037860.1 WD40 repeat domain-containing protein [Anaerolineales bacterium]